MTKKFVLSFVAGALLALTAGSTAWAGRGQEASDWTTLQKQMTAQGWTEIVPGVFERQPGPGNVEHMGYGREGVMWTIGDLMRQHDLLRREAERFPSPALEQARDELALGIARARLELQAMPADMTPGSAASLAAAGCGSICFSSTANAFALTSTQGVSAVANASFNNACGYTGSTTAYAYARATVGTTTSTYTQTDPKSGSSISSAASATVNGGSISGTPCYSTANSSVVSSALGISLSASSTNDGNCPAATTPPAPTISGTTYEHFISSGAACRSRTFTSSVSGGTAPFSYQWKQGATVLGTGSSYTRSICPYDVDFTLTLIVTDAASRTGSDTHTVTIDVGSVDPCFAAQCP